MEGMLNDFALNADTQKKFNDYVAANPSAKPPIEFSCDVLTTGHWPSFKILNPELHPVFAKCLDIFTAHYEKDTEHRKLTWVHSLGNAVVKGNFKVSYDFQVTTLQALGMLVFNAVADGKETMTFAELNKHLGNLDVEVTKRILHSLSCQKIHVLNKEPESKKIEETDVFRVNVEFQSKIRKVRIPMASLEESHNPQRVEEDRGLAIEAAIVRIMKARKRLQHNLLVTEVVNQLRTFKPAPKLIKKKVEHLIEREYLKRDENEQNFYQYLA
jgi:cullin 1